MSDNKTMFVFYTMNPTADIVTWKYDFRFAPRGKRWEWVGSGSTSPVGQRKKLEYENEEQFSGHKDTTNITKEYLNNVFKGLKSCGVIKKFKIRMSYRP